MPLTIFIALTRKTMYDPGVEHYGTQDSIAIDRAEFIVTDLKKYTSYDHEIKRKGNWEKGALTSMQVSNQR